MALVAWYPLDGNTKDYAGNRDGSTIGSLSVNNDGKMGKTYTFSNNENGVNIPNENFTHINKYTVCAWVNPAGNHRNYNGSIISSGSWNVACWAFGLSQDNSQIDVAGNWYNKFINYRVPLNTWTHILCTGENDIVKLYVNGVYIGSKETSTTFNSNASNTCIGRETYASGHFSFNGKINDVRIYDEVLSLKEIKEIAKAKFIHYKFNSPSEERTVNLASTGLYPYSDYHDLTMTRTGLSYTMKRANTCIVIRKSGLSLTGKTLAISGYLKKNGIAIPFPGDRASTYEGAATSIKTDETGRFEIIQNYTVSNDWIFHYYQLCAVGDVITMEDLMIEEKDHCTPYCPNERLAYVRDSSGFRNDAYTHNLVESPSWTEDSVFGGGSFKFKNQAKTTSGNYQHFGSTKAIRIPEEGTLSYWIKQEGAQNADNKYAVGFSHFCSINNGGIMGWIYYYEASKYTSKTSSADFIDGNWHHYLVTWSEVANKLKFYRDSVLVGEHDMGPAHHIGTFRDFTVGNAWGTDYGGHSGGIDDIRVYATVLSEDDIKSLYESKGSITKDGKLYVKEFIEKPNLFSASVILDRQKEIGANSDSKIFFKDGIRCLGLSASSFYQGEYKSATPSGYFKPNTQYKFKFRMNGNLIYNGNEVPFGFIIKYSDGTESGFYHQTAGQWRTFELTTTAGKSIKDLTVYYYIGEIFYLDIDKCSITEVSGIDTVNKKGQLTTKELIECPNVHLETKTAHGANWVQLFYHDNNGGTTLFSSDRKEFMKCNGIDKRSNLYLMELFRGKDDKFEFLLEYAGKGSEYNRWKQTSNFTREPIAGYEAVQVSWTSSYWGGLEYNVGGSTWVDGSVGHGDWYYAIGAKTAYSGGIPNDTGAETNWVKLWVRCENPSIFKFYKSGGCTANEFIEI